MTPKPAPKTFGIGSILPLAALLLAGSTVTLAALSSFGVFRSSTTLVGQSLPPTPAELGAALARVGVTPETLTAAGVQAGGATQVVADARTYLDAEHFSALNTADAEWQTAKRSTERLDKLVTAGRASPEDLAALRQAEVDLARAEADRETLLSALRDAATQSFSGNTAQTLTSIRANQGHDLDTAYLVNNRSESNWVTLRDAKASVRISEKIGEDPDPTCAQLVTRTNAEPEVAAAMSHLSSRLPQVRAAFDQALEG